MMPTRTSLDAVFGATIRRVETCSSTNDLARVLAEEGAAEGTVIVAREQTRGRGTKGRSWYSAKDQGLYFSVVLRPANPELTVLPLAAGLAAADAIQAVCGFEPELKWPNDILANGNKLGGILIEAGSWGNRPTYAILGLGLNVRQKSGEFPEEIRGRVASLSDATGATIDAGALFGGLMTSLEVRYREFNEGRHENLIREFQRRMDLAAGETITVLTDGEPRTGCFAGLDARGGLILEDESARTVFYSGEIDVVPAR